MCVCTHGGSGLAIIHQGECQSLVVFPSRGVGSSHLLPRRSEARQWIVFFVLLILPLPLSVQAEDLGELSANPYAPDSTANPFGAGSPFKPDGFNNPFSPYGSPFSNQSATNPFATDAPRLLARLSGLFGSFGLSGSV